MSPERIIFRGVRVIAGWPEQIEQSQLLPFYRLNGRFVERVRFGQEPSDWGAGRGPCHDCAAVNGEFHVPGCDVERCPVCDGQVFGCECNFESADEGRAYATKAGAP
jgi:hypothetical protein